MTEADWLAEVGASRMVEFVRLRATERKLRLFATACCRSRWADLTDPQTRKAVEVGEKYADGKVSAKWLSRKWHAAYYSTVASGFGNNTMTSLVWAALSCAMPVLREPPELMSAVCYLDQDDIAFANTLTLPKLARCVFGNPFRPAAVNSSWLTSTVVALAEGIYADRAFDRLPILADALMDAGCDNEDVLNHCRGDGPHARGCWVVDLILGKS
jgi:hypothetical protein